jgi:saccharopine dehydrogenase-like NADP-dependent oxidoreductase
MTKNNIFIAGAGGIGRAVGLFLREIGDLEVNLYIGDVNMRSADNASSWIGDGHDGYGLIEPLEMPENGTDNAMNKVLGSVDIVLDCLPGKEAPRMAELARRNNIHYVNLTEYARETNEIIDIAKDAETGFILQTGLAPGFINILTVSLLEEFHLRHGIDKFEDVSMKVGALTRHAIPPAFYGFTWSPIGVATEYIEPAIVIRDYRKTTAPSLTGYGTMIIDGVNYEEALTSGGAADLPNRLEGKVKTLDYKTLRYPGHYKWIATLLDTIPTNRDRAGELQRRMLENIPIVEDDDVVVIYASVRGFDNSGRLHIIDKSFCVEPLDICGKRLRAIQSTTASSMAECARMLLTNKYEGVILQSEINHKDFLGGEYVSKAYGKSLS